MALGASVQLGFLQVPAYFPPSSQRRSEAVLTATPERPPWLNASSFNGKMVAMRRDSFRTRVSQLERRLLEKEHQNREHRAVGGRWFHYAGFMATPKCLQPAPTLFSQFLIGPCYLYAPPQSDGDAERNNPALLSWRTWIWARISLCRCNSGGTWSMLHLPGVTCPVHVHLGLYTDYLSTDDASLPLNILTARKDWGCMLILTCNPYVQSTSRVYIPFHSYQCAYITPYSKPFNFKLSRLIL